jgi:osmotically-inducible protein OsmY
MFLSSSHAGASGDFSRDHGISCGRPAVEAELHYIPGLDCSDIRVEENGPFIVLEGSVASSGDLARVTRVATEIAGSDRVICQLVIVPNAKHKSPVFLA